MKIANNRYLFVLTIAIVTVLNIFFASMWPQCFSNTELAMNRLIVFSTGCFCAPMIYEEKKIKVVDLFLFGICFITLRMIRVIFIDPESIYCEILVRSSNVFLTLLICFVCAKLLDICPYFLNAVLKWFGKMSLELYLVHMFANSIWLNTALGQRNNTVISYFIVILPISILISAIIYYGRQTIQKR